MQMAMSQGRWVMSERQAKQGNRFFLETTPPQSSSLASNFPILFYVISSPPLPQKSKEQNQNLKQEWEENSWFQLGSQIIEDLPLARASDSLCSYSYNLSRCQRLDDLTAIASRSNFPDSSEILLYQQSTPTPTIHQVNSLFIQTG